MTTPITAAELALLSQADKPSGDSGGIFEGLSDEEILARRNPEGRSDEEVLARQSATSSATGVGNPGEEAANTPPQTRQIPLPNPLSDYESYTYGLSLHLLSQTQYNNLIENPDTSYIPQNVLVASAGKNSNNFKRDPNFREDFYFDDFHMKTIVNVTTRNRNSNLIECSFTIVEPVGFTFINRLVAACQDIGSANYLKQPYLLQIDFYGYKDGVTSGSPIPNLSKYIPIALTSMKSKVSTKGTEYKIDAVPYNHQAFNQTHVVSPAIFKIKALTVADMFGTGRVTNVNTEAFALAQREAAKLERAKSALAAGSLDREDFFELNQMVNEASTISTVFQVSGFCDALNAWFAGLKDINKKITVVNQYKVEFFKEIGDSKLFPTDTPNDVNNAAAGGSTTAAGKTAARAAGGLPVGTVEWNSGTFNIPMGMQIDKLIDYAVRNSDYIRKQLLVPELPSTGADLTAIKTKSGSPLKWYKIVPKIKIKQYDPTRQQYAYEITFCVKPWTVNTKYPYTFQGRTSGYVKQYEWMYTGRNTEVIDLQIDFDMLYYQQLTAFPNAKAQGTTGETIQTAPKLPDTPPPQFPLIPSSVEAVQPLAVTYVSNDYRTQTLPGAAAAFGTASGDLQRDLTSSSRGDMINIQLKIIGDPQLIKQDDLFYAQNIRPPTSQLTPNNSLYYDGGELYVNIIFQSPVDYDESTGLAIPNLGRYTYNLFNGIYKIITVDNNFRQGKFEQTLDLIRLPVNAQDINQLINARARIETYVNYGLGQLAGLPYSRFTGPRILVNNLAAGTGIYNAGVAGGGGVLSGLVGGIVNQFVGKVTNELIGKATGAIKDVFSGLGGQVPADQLLAAQNAQEGFRAAEYGLNNPYSPYGISDGTSEAFAAGNEGFFSDGTSEAFAAGNEGFFGELDTNLAPDTFANFDDFNFDTAVVDWDIV
jgi:hypothetical protein